MHCLQQHTGLSPRIALLVKCQVQAILFKKEKERKEHAEVEVRMT